MGSASDFLDGRDGIVQPEWVSRRDGVVKYNEAEFGGGMGR